MALGIRRSSEFLTSPEIDNKRQKIREFRSPLLNPRNDERDSSIEKEIQEIFSKIQTPPPENTVIEEFPHTEDIKNWMSKNGWQRKDISEVNHKMNAIVNHDKWGDLRKRAELGLLYFYLARDNTIHNAASFVEKRFNEINQEAGRLQLTHRMHCPPKYLNSFSSGAVAYVMRALARMIITPDGAFNEGGCYAVKALILSKLSILIEEEMKAQILTVVDRLLSDGSFRNKLMMPISVHPDLHELIRLDLKLPVDAEIEASYVRWDLLISLFSLIGQANEGNCYAVGLTANLINQQHGLVLDLLRGMLQTGHFTLESQNIPVLPILEGRRCEEDFEASLPGQSAVNLAGFIKADQCIRNLNFGLSSSDSEEFTSQKSTRDASKIPEDEGEKPKAQVRRVDSDYVPPSKDIPFSEVIKGHFKEQAPLAAKYILSLKWNFLQQALIGIFQFISNNSMAVAYRENLPLYSNKHTLITKLVEMTFPQDLYSKEVRDRYFCKLAESLYFVDENISIEIDGNRVKFGSHKGLLFNGNLNDYTPFMHLRRLYLNKNGNFSPVDSISDLTQILCECVEATYKGNMGLFKQFFKEPSVSQEIARIIHKFNRKMVSEKFQSDIYHDGNSIPIVQRGGYLEFLTCWGPLKERFAQPVKISHSRTVPFLIELCKAFKQYSDMNHSYFNKRNPHILTSCRFHIFNLNFDRLVALWKVEENKESDLSSNPHLKGKDPISPIQTNIYDRIVEKINKFKEKKPTADQKSRILREAFQPKIFLPEIFPPEIFPPKTFPAEVVQKIEKKVVASIGMNTFRSRVLNELGNQILNKLKPVQTLNDEGKIEKFNQLTSFLQKNFDQVFNNVLKEIEYGSFQVALSEIIQKFGVPSVHIDHFKKVLHALRAPSFYLIEKLASIVHNAIEQKKFPVTHSEIEQVLFEQFPLATKETTICYQTFKEVFHEIFLKLGFEISDPEKDNILERMDKIRLPKHYSSGKLSNLLYKTFVLMELPHYPQHFIENVLCDQFSLPPVYDLGLLNWAGEKGERVNFIRLYAIYDAAKDDVDFSKRVNGIDLPLPGIFEHLKDHTELYFEKPQSRSLNSSGDGGVSRPL